MERQESLIYELGAWKDVENIVAQSFTENELTAKSFLKMKLREYDRIYQRFKGGVYTSDERALMKVLRYQRKKLEKELYPGLLRKLIHRTAVLLRPPLDFKREVAMARGDWFMQGSPAPGNHDPLEKKKQQERYEAKHAQGFDMGPKKDQDGKQQGMSL